MVHLSNKQFYMSRRKAVFTQLGTCSCLRLEGKQRPNLDVTYINPRVPASWFHRLVVVVLSVPQFVLWTLTMFLIGCLELFVDEMWGKICPRVYGEVDRELLIPRFRWFPWLRVVRRSLGPN